MTKLVCGVGVNDADYKVHKYENGKTVWRCPFYKRWECMLNRAYSPKCHQRYPTYKDVTVCKEWHTFSNFREWMITQDWEGKELDKDFLVEGNRIYSPETCVFIDRIVNTFSMDRGASRGDFMIGVNLHQGGFTARCSNPFTKKREYLGRFATELEGHLAWKQRKHEHALKLAEQQTDKRVAEALRNRYSS